MRGAAAPSATLIPQLSLAVARILGQLGELVRVPIEDLFFLLVRVTALVGPLRVLAAPSVSFRDVVLPKLADIVVWPLLGRSCCGSVLGRRFFDAVELGAIDAGAGASRGRAHGA